MKLARQERPGHIHGRHRALGLGFPIGLFPGHIGDRPRVAGCAQLASDERAGLGSAVLQLLQLFQHVIQPQALDELHDVIRHAVLLADAEDRDDVGVVQLGSGFRLALEPPLGLGVQQHVLGQHLERHVAPQRHLLGLVDDAHAPLADLAEDAEIAELPQARSGGCRRLLGGFLVIFLDLLDLDHGGEQLADVLGQLGMAVDVLLETRPFAGSIACGELVGELGEQDVVGGAVGGLVRHRRVLPACWRGWP